MHIAADAIIEISTYLPLGDVVRLAAVDQKTRQLRREMLLCVNKLVISKRESVPYMIRNCPNTRVVEIAGLHSLCRAEFEMLNILPIESLSTYGILHDDFDEEGRKFNMWLHPIRIRMSKLKSITVDSIKLFNLSECPALEHIRDLTAEAMGGPLDFNAPIDWATLSQPPAHISFPSPEK